MKKKCKTSKNVKSVSKKMSKKAGKSALVGLAVTKATKLAKESEVLGKKKKAKKVKGKIVLTAALFLGGYVAAKKLGLLDEAEAKVTVKVNEVKHDAKVKEVELKENVADLKLATQKVADEKIAALKETTYKANKVVSAKASEVNESATELKGTLGEISDAVIAGSKAGAKAGSKAAVKEPKGESVKPAPKPRSTRGPAKVKPVSPPVPENPVAD